MSPKKTKEQDNKVPRDERFHAAREAVLGGEYPSSDDGIGTLGERVLHRILKLYTDPCRENHEVSYLGYVVDVMNCDGITEIQTRDFARLSRKLGAFLGETHVTLVYPITRYKTLVWLDPETGEAEKPRKSPRRGRPSDALPELSRISEHLGCSTLTVKLFMLDTEDYREKNGRGKDRKHYATRYERIPTELVEVITLRAKEDYKRLIPDTLGEAFTAREFEKAAALRGRRAYFSLKLLLDLGALAREKVGRGYLYRRA